LHFIFSFLQLHGHARHGHREEILVADEGSVGNAGQHAVPGSFSDQQQCARTRAVVYVGSFAKNASQKTLLVRAIGSPPLTMTPRCRGDRAEALHCWFCVQGRSTDMGRAGRGPLKYERAFTN
jgi:hypothetical protein